MPNALHSAEHDGFRISIYSIFLKPADDVSPSKFELCKKIRKICIQGQISPMDRLDLAEEFSICIYNTIPPFQIYASIESSLRNPNICFWEGGKMRAEPKPLYVDNERKEACLEIVSKEYKKLKEEFVRRDLVDHADAFLLFPFLRCYLSGNGFD